MADRKIRLTEAIQEFTLYRKSEGISKGTARNDAYIMRKFLTITTDLYVASLDMQHLTRYFATVSETRSPASLHIDHSVLRSFFAWAVRRRYVGRFDNPMEGRKKPAAPHKERNRLAVGRFGALLDAAGERHPRNRMVIALGLFLFIRGSEVVSLKVRDANLDTGEILVTMDKLRGEQDLMPISEELDEELRRWLTYYTETCGPLDPDWHLVPALHSHTAKWDHQLGKFVGQDYLLAKPNPVNKITKVEDIAQLALDAIGYPIRDRDGKSLREGIHTLRRSGARARFDHLEYRGYDGAIRHVQTMLHHKAMSMTEHYLGLTLDKVKRNELVRGKRMFDLGDNVVELRSVTATGE